jgi:ATP-dependent DNA helicase DinG
MSGSADHFSPGGALAAIHERFEHRPGQAQMAQAVASAIARRHQLIVEAGTGTGKTLAYLIPALASRQTVIVSTGTKALQQQLLDREVPLAQQALDLRIDVRLLKGRENYLCKRRLAELIAEPRFELASEVNLFRRLRSWSLQTETGDRAEIQELPDASPLWRSVDGRAEICTGRHCSDYARCFVYSARQAAAQATLVVVNHALLFADLALRERGEGAVLPAADVLIIDEAHLVPEIAAQHFGSRLTSRMVIEIARDGARELAYLQVDSAPATALERAAREFFAQLRTIAPVSRARFEPRTSDRNLERLDGALRSALSGLAAACAGSGPRSEERLLISSRAVTAEAILDELLGPVGDGTVVTIEPIGKEGASLASWPLAIGERLSDLMARYFQSVVATSATLASGGKLDRAARALGMEAAETAIVPSPFDHRQQAALYIPAQFPDPREPQFADRALREIESLLALSRGRALVLFASHRALRHAAGQLVGNLPWTVLVQGEAPREQLVEQFRAETHSVLLGTASFRQGIDIPGEALSLVIVDKLPFAVPDDPLVAARSELIRGKGGDPFREEQLPDAILDLRQALGRLIRTQSDRGLLALLDVRVRTRGYGREVLRSLPPWPLLGDLEQARSWLSRI